MVLSGGLDSTTLLYRLVNSGHEVHAISFFYGQKHKKELSCAQATCEKLGVSHKIIDVSFLGELLDSSLTRDDQEVPEWHYTEESMKSTVVPNRNMIFTSIAVGYAQSIKADQVALWIHAGDHAIYPDCRRKFIEKLDAVVRISDRHEVQLLYPFIDKDKGDIVKKWIQNNVDYSLTRTCYKWKEKACGKCGSCVERLEAFEKNGIEDPVEYDFTLSTPIL